MLTGQGVALAIGLGRAVLGFPSTPAAGFAKSFYALSERAFRRLSRRQRCEWQGWVARASATLCDNKAR